MVHGKWIQEQSSYFAERENLLKSVKKAEERDNNTQKEITELRQHLRDEQYVTLLFSCLQVNNRSI